MSGEVEIGGVFIPLALVGGVAAFVLSLVLRRVFRSLRLYQIVWHAGLFDVATFVVVWWLIAYLAGDHRGA